MPDYSKVSTETLQKLMGGNQVDYAGLPTEDLVALHQAEAPRPTGMKAKNAYDGIPDEELAWYQKLERFTNGRPGQQTLLDPDSLENKKKTAVALGATAATAMGGKALLSSPLLMKAAKYIGVPTAGAELGGALLRRLRGQE